MFRNYLTVGLRALTKSKTYAFISIFGLAIGMAACLLILLFVRYEMSYDAWIPGAADTYQVQTWLTGEAGGETRLQTSPYPGVIALKKDFPQIERIVYAMGGAPVFFRNGQPSPVGNYFYADGNFVDVVHLPVLRGAADALDHVGTAAISQSEAVRRFGTDDVVGRTFTLISSGRKTDFRIGAVLRDIPRNSHLRINAMMRVDFPAYFADQSQMLSCWGCPNGWTYVRLRPGTDPRAIEAQFSAWKKRNIPDQNSGTAHFNPGEHQSWHVVRVSEIHLGPAQAAAISPGSDRTTILTFAVIAVLILAMAVINSTNLATARASQRAREVALRKVLGASRRQLVGQFLGESTLVASLAMLTALAMVEMSLRPLSAFLDADFRLTYFVPGGVAAPALILVAVVGLLGGLYPAFFLSRFEPAAVLKANRSGAETPGSGRFRSLLVVGQFAVAIGLIVCTAVIYGQSVFARTVDPGYGRDHVLQLSGLSRRQLAGKGAAIEAQVRRLPGVDAVGLTGIGVATGDASDTGVVVPGHSQPISIGNYFVDTGFRNALGLRLLAGRWFDDSRRMDDMTLPAVPDPAAEKALIGRGANIVVNVAAARKLGFLRPADIVGRNLKIGVNGSMEGLMTASVVGLVGDARFRSVKLPIEPMLFEKAETGESYMVIRFHGDPAALRTRVERIWKGFTSEVPFDAQFSDDIVRDLYRTEDMRAEAFAAFALLSALIGCLGLFGLSSFTAERRTKEIGIRKVLGARTRDIVRLLVWQFSRPVLIANLIAWPVAWWVLRDWLNTFDARIDLTPGPFVLAGLIAFAIAIGTVAGHAMRVARLNPIHALRYE